MKPLCGIALALLVAACTVPAPSPTPAPTPTRTPVPIPATFWWEQIWEFVEDEDDVGVEAPSIKTSGRAQRAFVLAVCNTDLRSPRALVWFDLSDPTPTPEPTPTPRPTFTPRPTPRSQELVPLFATREAARWATATAVPKNRRATATAMATSNREQTAVARARTADDTVDDIFISRRDAGEPGRWLKSGWRHYSSKTGALVLVQEPGAAMIEQLKETEEFAVLVTHDHGPNTAAVFDVRYLQLALDDPGVRWEC